ncbi:hypothetical protein KI387_026007 [Taxus chinensis]|uniref:CBM20 domain-containing protein n=1 Tax=Taxus chinensis TaxID=29808 RepID=A0AA38L860_TAXCH|nr:hypothetical protein KI387_026007 [Taxus chinensis]
MSWIASKVECRAELELGWQAELDGDLSWMDERVDMVSSMRWVAKLVGDLVDPLGVGACRLVNNPLRHYPSLYHIDVSHVDVRMQTASVEGKLPVMVYFHSGGFYALSTTDVAYDTVLLQSLVARGVRIPQLNNLVKSSDNFGVDKGAKAGKVFLNLAEGSSACLRSLPYGAAVNNNRRSWKVPVSTQDEINSDDVVTHIIPDDSKSSHEEQGPPLVDVKFVLQKKCKFGQQFSVVGEDPLLGTWDPKASLPLEWSEGDIWTTEVNVPVGKHIEYKFILRGKRGELLWQPGPNQVFDTLETVPSMVVSSPWEEEEVIISRTGYEDKTEITEQGIKDENSDANLGETIEAVTIDGIKDEISLNAASGEGAIAIEAVDVGSDAPNGAFGVSIKNTEDNTKGEYSIMGVYGTPDALGPSNVKQKERGAASPSETM